jgi:hypothetical protein
MHVLYSTACSYCFEYPHTSKPLPDVAPSVAPVGSIDLKLQRPPVIAPWLTVYSITMGYLSCFAWNYLTALLPGVSVAHLRM